MSAFRPFTKWQSAMVRVLSSQTKKNTHQPSMLLLLHKPRNSAPGALSSIYAGSTALSMRRLASGVDSLRKNAEAKTDVGGNDDLTD